MQDNAIQKDIFIQTQEQMLGRLQDLERRVGFLEEENSKLKERNEHLSTEMANIKYAAENRALTLQEQVNDITKSKLIDF